MIITFNILQDLLATLATVREEAQAKAALATAEAEARIRAAAATEEAKIKAAEEEEARIKVAKEEEARIRAVEVEAATQACATATATAAFRDIAAHEEEDKAARLLSPSTLSPTPPSIAAIKDVKSIKKLEVFLDSQHIRLRDQCSRSIEARKEQAAQNNQLYRPLCDQTEFIHEGKRVTIVAADWTRQEKRFRDIILPIVKDSLKAYMTTTTVINDEATFEKRFNEVYDKEDNHLEKDDAFDDYTGLSLSDFRAKTKQKIRSKRNMTNEKAVRYKRFQGRTPLLTLNMTGMSADHTTPLCNLDANCPEDYLWGISALIYSL